MSVVECLARYYTPASPFDVLQYRLNDDPPATATLSHVFWVCLPVVHVTLVTHQQEGLNNKWETVQQ